jgi:RimJ/RimL family protein N-acetyltransferase
MPGPAFKVGDRVSLHPIEPEDHEFLQRGRNHPETRVPLTDTDIRSLDDVEARLEDEEHRYLICVADQREATGETSGEERPANREDGEDPEPVGVVAFPWVRDSTKVGSLMYWVAPEHQGKGYATEGTSLFLDYVFGECGFHKVNARVNASNAASATVLEKLGFQREGTRRAESIVDGEFEDMHMYGLLADEWLN